MSNQQEETTDQQAQQEMMRKLMNNGVDLKCNNCGNIYFYSANRIRFFEQLESPNGQEGIHPLDEYICTSCDQPLNVESEAQKAKIDRNSYQRDDDLTNEPQQAGPIPTSDQQPKKSEN